jgi:glycosyltransferase involved in cell wall biosynthesis
MPKILFIAAHRPNRSPSQRYRFEQYFNFLKQKGYEFELSYIIDEHDDAIFYSPGKILHKIWIVLKSIAKRLNDIKRANSFDIVFIQREAFMMGTSFFEKQLSKTKAKLVFDFDDSIWLMDTSNANKIWEWLKSSEKTSRIISHAHLVFAGNKYLYDYAKRFNSNVKIIPTTIDTEFHKRKMPYTNNTTVCIGWSGSITTIKHFEQALPVLKKIKEKYGDKVVFKVMGDATYKNSELNISGIAWSNDTEVNIISSFDIGIMPLPDNEWVKGKCGLKGLSYMALEIPTIMSDIGVNSEIINEGVNGYLAVTEDDWIDKLSALIDSFELRKQLGSNARKTVLEKYSTLAQQNNYVNSFDELLTR